MSSEYTFRHLLICFSVCRHCSSSGLKPVISLGSSSPLTLEFQRHPRSFDSTSEISLMFSIVILLVHLFIICLLNCCNNFLKGLQLWSPLTVIYFTLQATQPHPLVWNAWMISFCLQDQISISESDFLKSPKPSLFLTKSLAIHPLVSPINITTLNFLPCAKLSLPVHTSFFLKLFLVSQLLSPCMPYITASLSVWKNSWNFSKPAYILPRVDIGTNRRIFFSSGLPRCVFAYIYILAATNYSFVSVSLIKYSRILWGPWFI